jgi:hypothetical protein
MITQTSMIATKTTKAMHAIAITDQIIQIVTYRDQIIATNRGISVSRINFPCSQGPIAGLLHVLQESYHQSVLKHRLQP